MVPSNSGRVEVDESDALHPCRLDLEPCHIVWPRSVMIARLRRPGIQLEVPSFGGYDFSG